MFGYFRFFLASLVLISHVGINYRGFNPGVAAVVSFYMLAGFVVCHLFSKIFKSEKPLYFHFYYERALRIFPQYLFIAGLTLIFIFTTKFGDPMFAFMALINNMVVIPLNYYMVFDNSILQQPKWWLIPPAWSLGVELQAYLVLPFIIYFRPIKILLAIASLAVFIVASMGVINTDYFCYRLLPGVLFIFILGTSIYKNTSTSAKPDLFDQHFPMIVYVSLLVLSAILGVRNMLSAPYVKETILGTLIGLPIVTFLANRDFKAPINHLLGDLSYGMFLSHFLAIWVIHHFSLIDKSKHLYLYVGVVFIISLTLALAGVLAVEKNVKKYRFSLSKSINH